MDFGFNLNSAVTGTLVGFAGIWLILLLIKMINIAEQYERVVVFRLGRVNRLAGPGLFLTVPFIERRVVRDIRLDQASIPPQEAITRDNVPIKVNAVVWFKIVDSIKSCIEIADYKIAVQQLAQTHLRIILGQNTLDQILKEQDRIAELMKANIDKFTEAWGVEITSVEMKNIEIPKTMERVMAAEAEAEREKTARLIKADGELQASEKLASAAANMTASPGALELRRLQTMTEIGAEQNTMMVLCLPQEFIHAADAVSKLVKPT